MKKKYYIARIFSSRGTDDRICFCVDAKLNKSEIRRIVDAWADDEIRRRANSGYYIQYWPVKMLTRKIWLKKWNVVCKQYNKIKTAKDNLRVMNNPKDWTKKI